MNKEEFLEIRKHYRTDLECIKGENFSKDQFYKWKVEFGLSKRSKADKERAKQIENLSKENFIKICKKYNNDKERAKALNLGLTKFREIKKRFGVTAERDTSVINKDEFLEFYNKGLNDREIGIKLNTNGKRICAFRTKLNLPSNLKKPLKFTPEQYQIFIGGLLGDSCLTIPKKLANARFSFAHSLKQKGYAEWKFEKLKNLCENPSLCKEYNKRQNKTYNYISVKSHVNILFTEYVNKFYYNNGTKRIKYINEEILDTLEPLGIAIWFMDDGYKEDCGYCISTNCFSSSDLKLIVKFFIDKYDIYPTIHASKVLYIGSKYKDKFTKIIAPYIHPELKYKLHQCPV